MQNKLIYVHIYKEVFPSAFFSRKKQSRFVKPVKNSAEPLCGYKRPLI